MNDNTYDAIKVFLSRWAFPIMIILGALGTFLTSMGFDATVFTTALVAFIAALCQAFQVNVEKARIEYYGNDAKKNS